MDLPGPPRPRVSRETRLLLVTLLISMAALWALARIRFPERPATTNPVPPLLTQLAARPAFEDLAFEITDLESRLLPSLVAVEVHPPATSAIEGADRPGAVIAGLRIRDDLAVALLSAPGVGAFAAPAEGSLFARDAASGLAIVRVPGAPAPALEAWSPRRMDRPRYLVASDVSRAGPSLRPVFVGRLDATASPAWPGDLWGTPARAGLAPGMFLFTTEGALAGLVVEHEGTPAIVPGATVIEQAERLRRERTPEAGRLGVEVQALTPAIAAATGARAGVIVVWVDPKGPGADVLAVMDVIEAAGDDPILSPDRWRARETRVTPGEQIALRVRRSGEVREIRITAQPQPAPEGPLPLGLTMRSLPGVGAEVVRVDPRSAGARAGLQAGDVITAAGGLTRPSPAQVTRAFAASTDRPILIAITRGDAHHVVALGTR